MLFNSSGRLTGYAQPPMQMSIFESFVAVAITTEPRINSSAFFMFVAFVPVTRIIARKLPPFKSSFNL